MKSAEKIEASLNFLMRSFRTVLDDVGASEVAEHLPWRDRWDSASSCSATEFPAEIAEACVQAYSIAFQLLNKSEENAVAQNRRDLERDGKLSDDPGSWDQMLARALAVGMTGGELSELLAKLRVEPVFTAHPTEAKRQTVLEHHRQLYRLLVELENSMWTGTERGELEDEVKACLERLWRTGEIYLEKPSLADERAGVLYYLRHVLPDVLPWFTRRLCSAWNRAGLPRHFLDHPDRLPRVEFGDWVGGDRDGHPGVTAEVTTGTLQLFRQSALELIDERLSRLATRFSLSQFRQETPPRLTQTIEALAAGLGDEGRSAIARNPSEPWRQHINLLRASLPFEDRPVSGRFPSADALLTELRGLREMTISLGALRLARTDIDPIITLVRSFGFHLAVLDIRQNSAFHDRALAQLLQIAGVEDASDYPAWGAERRLKVLEEELASRRPFAAPTDIEGYEATAVLNVYQRLADHRRQHGDAGLGALIVSMTRSLEDLLAVYVLARDGGLLLESEDGRWSPLEVVPLFETIDDLERAPGILDAYLSHPIVRNSLLKRQEARKMSEPVQQVMIGYSDSCKDGGIVCSFWSLYQGQRRLAEVGRKHGVRIRFFHGRGGTIGRGAGPTHRFVKALPTLTAAGDLRLTEQGESIAQNYANRVTASHHLELLAACTLYATAADKAGRKDPAELLALMDALAHESRVAYRALLDSEGFVSFFEQATPLDVIEASRIGSRPARRTGKRSLGDLRAIPWVFSWNQSRFGLPGWYGLGSALMGLRERDPEQFERLLVAKGEGDQRWDPFHYLISNAATAIQMSSVEVMERYAGLLKEKDIRERIMSRILHEHGLTSEALSIIYGAPLALSRERIHREFQRRHDALSPLHDHQISLLVRWRAHNLAGEDQAAAKLLPELLLTVNAIASGLGATG